MVPAHPPRRSLPSIAGVVFNLQIGRRLTSKRASLSAGEGTYNTQRDFHAGTYPSHHSHQGEIIG